MKKDSTLRIFANFSFAIQAAGASHDNQITDVDHHR